MGLRSFCKIFKQILCFEQLGAEKNMAALLPLIFFFQSKDAVSQIFEKDKFYLLRFHFYKQKDRGLAATFTGN